MPAQREVTETEIRQRFRQVVAGLQAKDLDALRQRYAPDVVSFDVEPPLQHVGIEAKLANWSRTFAMFADLSYELRDLTIVAADDLAVAYGFARLSGTLRDGTTTGGAWVRVTYCLRNIEGDWLIVQDHVSVPFDFPTGKGVVDLTP